MHSLQKYDSLKAVVIVTIIVVADPRGDNCRLNVQIAIGGDEQE